MKSYDPDWKQGKRGKAHLVAKKTGHYGHDPKPTTLCRRSAKNLKHSAGSDPDCCKRCLTELPRVRAALVGGVNVAFLDERSYMGRVAGAYHWSGSLCLGEVPAVDLTFRMTYLQARAENDKDPSYEWEAGEESNRFFTQEALRAHACLRLRELFPEARALFAGSAATCGPCGVLWLHEDFARAFSVLNSIHDRWETLEYNHKESNALETEWDAVLATHGLIRWER